MANFERFGGKTFVLGYTGEIGKVLVKYLLESKHFDKIVLIGRREITELPGVDDLGACVRNSQPKQSLLLSYRSNALLTLRSLTKIPLPSAIARSATVVLVRRVAKRERRAFTR